MTLFDIKRDIEIENTGGFWCHGCLVGRLADEQSDDPRYCHGCFKFLLDEVVLLSEKHKNPGWVPVPGRTEASLDKREVVAKLTDKGKIPEGVLHHSGGRPRKEGKVHRVTEWRRRKAEESQGVLV